jgi:hypothetical protein
MNLPINLFDLLALIIVVGGIVRGRKRGLSITRAALGTSRGAKSDFLSVLPIDAAFWRW